MPPPDTRSLAAALFPVPCSLYPVPVELSVNHVTAFQYDGPVTDSVNEVRLAPLTDAHQQCLDFRLTVQPPAEVRSYVDWLGNTAHTFEVIDAHTSLEISARSRVITNAFGRLDDLSAALDRYRPIAIQDAGEVIDFLQATARADFSPAIRALAEAVRDAQPDDRLGPLVWALALTVNDRLDYVPGATDVGTVASDALLAGRGVCQDLTHIMLAAVRLLGIPARYTSGYFHPEGAGGEVGEQASHAWVEVWFPESGWVGVDPTNRTLAGERYIRIAYGRDYADVAPVRGSYRGAETSALDVYVSVSAGSQQQQ